MKEWIINNTYITESQYDSIINPNTVIMNNTTGIKTQENCDHPLKNINLFTLKKSSYFRRQKYQITKKKDCNKQNCYTYQSLEFYILAEFFKKAEDWLYSSERFQQCFILNSYICKNLNTNCNIITALCKSPYRTKKEEYLHTFIQIITNDNQEYIIDGTANIIMKKETYFNIFKPQIISIIDKKQLQEDLELIKPFNKSKLIYIGEYLCFPKQVRNSVKKLAIKK